LIVRQPRSGEIRHSDVCWPIEIRVFQQAIGLIDGRSSLVS